MYACTCVHNKIKAPLYTRMFSSMNDILFCLSYSQLNDICIQILGTGWIHQFLLIYYSMIQMICIGYNQLLTASSIIGHELTCLISLYVKSSLIPPHSSCVDNTNTLYEVTAPASVKF